MKLLLDQGLPRSTTAALRVAGHDAVHVGEIGLATAADGAILEAARRNDQVVVTLDADFHALLAVAGASKPSVIRIRIEALKGEQLAGVLAGVLQRFDDDLRAGACVSVLPNRARVRRLPLRRSSSESGGPAS